MLEKQQKRYRRHKRVTAKIRGTAEHPRLCVFRSAKHIYAQLIDDEKGRTLISASDLEMKNLLKIKDKKEKTKIKNKKTEKSETVRTGKGFLAFEVGKLIAQKSLKKKIEKVVFDRGGFLYHGRVKSLAEGAREGGLKF